MMRAMRENTKWVFYILAVLVILLVIFIVLWFVLPYSQALKEMLGEKR